MPVRLRLQLASECHCQLKWHIQHSLAGQRWLARKTRIWQLPVTKKSQQVAARINYDHVPQQWFKVRHVPLFKCSLDILYLRYNCSWDCSNCLVCWSWLLVLVVLGSSKSANMMCIPRISNMIIISIQVLWILCRLVAWRCSGPSCTWVQHLPCTQVVPDTGESLEALQHSCNWQALD